MYIAVLSKHFLWRIPAQIYFPLTKHQSLQLFHISSRASPFDFFYHYTNFYNNNVYYYSACYRAV